MAQKPFLSVVIPAYNEAKRLPLTLIDIDKHLQKASFVYEIIVVDNNSKDATKEIAQRFTSIIKNLRVIIIDDLPIGITRLNDSHITGIRASSSLNGLTLTANNHS